MDLDRILDDRILFSRSLTEQTPLRDGCDGVLCQDKALLRKDRDGHLQVNPHSQTYRQVEAVLTYV